MATMATTSHSLSVLTNASVKPPLNPKTGLANSIHERRGPDFCRLSGIYYEDYDDNAEADREILDPRQKFATVDDPMSIIRLGKLSDEEFYQKLLELKSEQRKILQKCEQIYIEKCNQEIKPTFSGRKSGGELQNGLSSRSLKTDTFRSTTIIDDDGVLVSTQNRILSPKRSQSPVGQEQRTMPPPAFDRTEHESFTSKPPTGKSCTSYLSKSLISPTSDLKRPSSAPIPHRQAWSTDNLKFADIGLSHSFEESDDDFVPDDTVSEPYRQRDISKTMNRIEGMWHDFSIEDYAPRRSQTQRIMSATEPRREKKKDEKWRHRLTVPEPFTMTLREERKERAKSKTQLEFEEKLLQKEKEEEEECRKKFKARPVPAHVYLPLFDEIHEKQEEKRRHNRQMSSEMLKSQEKPFSFLKREEDRKIHKRFDKDSNQEPVPERSGTPTFKAKPVPKYIFDNSVDDKLMEEEEYRKIRMKMRSEEMMRSASLPPSMAAREKAKEQEVREQKMKKRKAKKSARLRINHEVPNYDALYLQFQKELQGRKGQREATIAEPFRLSARAEKMDKIRKDIERDEETLRENRWPYKMSRKKPVNLGHMSMSLDSLPSKSTKSADVRNRKVRNQLQQLTEREKQEIEDDRRRRVREMRLRREITERMPRETPRESPAERKKKVRDAERSRMEEYEREMQEMKERVNRRPLLIEQETQDNAKKKAEKKFNATLKSVGLDEDFIESRGSRSASVHDDYTDDYDDDYEDTAVRNEDQTYTKHADSEGDESPME